MIAGVQLCMAECLGESKFLLGKTQPVLFVRKSLLFSFVHTKHLSIAIKEEIRSSALQLTLESNQDLKKTS